jgi:hypothetical protein
VGFHDSAETRLCAREPEEQRGRVDEGIGATEAIFGQAVVTLGKGILALFGHRASRRSIGGRGVG